MASPVMYGLDTCHRRDATQLPLPPLRCTGDHGPEGPKRAADKISFVSFFFYFLENTSHIIGPSAYLTENLAEELSGSGFVMTACRRLEKLFLHSIVDAFLSSLMM